MSCSTCHSNIANCEKRHIGIKIVLLSVVYNHSDYDDKKHIPVGLCKRTQSVFSFFCFVFVNHYKIAMLWIGLDNDDGPLSSLINYRCQVGDLW